MKGKLFGPLGRIKLQNHEVFKIWAGYIALILNFHPHTYRFNYFISCGIIQEPGKAYIYYQ